jgi:hypothetical protein
MDVLEYVLLAVGVICLVIGYRRNSRNILLVAALVLFAAAGLRGFVDGFVDGYSGPLASQR